MAAVDRMIGSEPPRRGYVALTALRDRWEAEAGVKLWRTRRTSGGVGAWAGSRWGSRKIDAGVRAEIRF